MKLLEPTLLMLITARADEVRRNKHCIRMASARIKGPVFQKRLLRRLLPGGNKCESFLQP